MHECVLRINQKGNLVGKCHNASDNNACQYPIDDSMKCSLDKALRTLYVSHLTKLYEKKKTCSKSSHRLAQLKNMGIFFPFELTNIPGLLAAKNIQATADSFLFAQKNLWNDLVLSLGAKEHDFLVKREIPLADYFEKLVQHSTFRSAKAISQMYVQWMGLDE